MKRFFVAACCSLMFCGSLMAQEATIAAPVAPGEDVAVAAVAQEAPVAVAQEQVAIEVTPVESGVIEGSVMTGTFVSEPAMPVYQDAVYGAVNSGCSSCGGNAAPQMYSVAPQMYSAAPQTFAAAPAMGFAAPASNCCGCNAAPAPVANCGCNAAPVADCGCNAAPVADCGCNAPVADCCNNGRNRGQVVRTVSTRGRSVLTRVRGRRNRGCCN